MACFCWSYRRIVRQVWVRKTQPDEWRERVEGATFPNLGQHAGTSIAERSTRATHAKPSERTGFSIGTLSIEPETDPQRMQWLGQAAITASESQLVGNFSIQNGKEGSGEGTQTRGNNKVRIGTEAPVAWWLYKYHAKRKSQNFSLRLPLGRRLFARCSLPDYASVRVADRWRRIA
jgi:hypothetical protein